MPRVALDAATAIAQIDSLVAAAAAGAKRADAMVGGGLFFGGTATESRALLTRMVATVERWARTGSPYRDQAARVLVDSKHDSSRVLLLAGVLQALRDDIEAGHLRTVEELIHADVFGDFLGMADELHGKGYKDPAAVIAGSVLEEHLRKLAATHDVPVETDDGRPIPADRINADLVKADAYTKLEQSQVTASLALRNRAAHGKYDEYDAGQVAGLIRDVRGFMIRHPA